MKKLMLFLVVLIALLVMVVIRGSNESFVHYVDRPFGIVEIEDYMGIKEIGMHPRRIITLDLGSLDALGYFGIGVVGVPLNDNLPMHLRHFNNDNVINVGSQNSLDFYAIRETEPDIIFISERHEEWYDELSAFSDVVRVHEGDDYFEAVEANLINIGLIFGLEERVEETIDYLRDGILDVHDLVVDGGYTALLAMVDGDEIHVFGPNSRYDVIYNDFGFEGVTESEANSIVEYIVDVDPDFLFVIDRGEAFGNEGTARLILDELLFSEAEANFNERTIFLYSNAWYMAQGGVNTTRIMITEMRAAVGSFDFGEVNMDLDIGIEE